MCKKTAKAIQLPFELWTRMGAKKHVLNRDSNLRSLHEKEQFRGGVRHFEKHMIMGVG